MDLPTVKLEILEVLLLHEKPVKATTVAKELGKEGKEIRAVQTRLFGLVRAGLAESPEKGQYTISQKGKISLGLPEVTKEKAHEILTKTPSDKAFHFYVGIGKPLHVYAYDLSDFCNKLNAVDLNTVSFHMERGDFEAWFKMLGDNEMAKKAALLKSRKLSGEELRDTLHALLGNRCIMLSEIAGQSVPS
jgi:Ribonuclease R winged-helix domain